MSSRLLLTLLALLYLPAWAQAPPSLTARPGLCILPNPDADQCVMTVQLDWNSSSPESLCLYSSQQNPALRCWDGVNTGSLSTRVVASDNVRFWLQRPGEEVRMAEVTVQIVSIARRSPERRRRRHIWSVL